MKTLRLVSFFSGIGAFEKALTNLEIHHEVVRFSEIDRYAIRNYCAIHSVDPAHNIGDVSQADLSTIPPFDLLTWGFPCQDISVAGNMKGLQGERSSLLRYALDAIKLHKPAYAIAENVKNLTSKRFAQDFRNLLQRLDELGYNNYWSVLNAADFGIPQNRERVFIVSIRKDLNQSFEFPRPPMFPCSLLDVLQDERDVPEKFYLPDELTRPLSENWLEEGKQGIFGVVKDHGELRQTDIALCIDANYHKGFDNHGQRTGLLVIGKLDIPGEMDYACRVYNPECLAPTVIAQPSKAPKIIVVGRIEQPGHDIRKRVYDMNGISPTLNLCRVDHTPKIAVLGRAEFIKGHDLMKRIYSVTGFAPTANARPGGNTEARIRRLTPLECWRLMGFNDADFHVAKWQKTSDTQLYRQAGNSIVVDVLQALLWNLFGDDKDA